MSLLATKPVDRIIAEAQETGEHTLRRALGPVSLTMLGIGAIIGTGIFVLTGKAAAEHAGPAVVLSMVLAGVVSALAAFCYSEFASTVPISGSAYAYGYATLGEFVAWIIGWDLILEYAFGAATVAVGWSGYVVSLLKDFGIQFPAALSAAPGTVVKTATGEVTAIFNLPAFLISIFVTLLLVKGIKESANFNSLIVIVKTSVVVLFIVAGIGFVNMANFEPFIPPPALDPNGNPVFGAYGWSGILTGAAVIFFAYIGFDAVSTAAQEAKNPARDMPIGIIGSLAICTVLYVLVSFVMVGLVPYKELSVPAPIAVAIDAAYRQAQATGSFFAPLLATFPTIVKVGAVMGLSSTMVVMVMGQPRIFYSMSRDGLLPKWASKVHPRFRTPYVTTLITGAIVATMAGFVNISILGELVSIGTLFAFVIVSLGVIIMRYTNPTLHRPFKVPLSPFFPIISAIASAYLMNGLPLDTWLRLILWTSFGLLVYFAYSYKHSNLAFIDNNANSENGPVENASSPPLSPIIGVLLIIAITILMFAFTDQSPLRRTIETGMRLFVWVTIGAMVYYLTFGRKQLVTRARDPRVARIGLAASVINVLVWLAVAYWFFVHFAELHRK